MNITMIRRTGFACLALAVLALLTLPIVQYAATTATGKLEACVNPGNGGLRLVDAAETCHSNETRVTWNITGPAGPPGPTGPPGPSAGGPPFVWVCTPAHFPNAGSSNGNIYVFNGSTSTANVAVNFLDSTGNNLAGVAVPGAAPPSNYPGEAGAATSPLGAANTRNIPFATPTTGGPGFDGVTNVSFTVRVTSDQPIAVGADFVFSGFHPIPCSLLPK